MTYIEKEFDRDGYHFIVVRIFTACCKRRFLVYEYKDTFIDTDFGNEVLWGTRDSIKTALTTYREENEKSNTNTRRT